MWFKNEQLQTCPLPGGKLMQLPQAPLCGPIAYCSGSIETSLVIVSFYFSLALLQMTTHWGVALGPV